MSNISDHMYNSLIRRYENEIQECKTTLLIYFESSVGIGDHSNHIDEMDGLISRMAEAYDKLKILKKIFKKNYSGGANSNESVTGYIKLNENKKYNENELYFSKL